MTQLHIHVIINPAAGQDEPILNTINDVFNRHQIDWTVSVTRKFGDATEIAREAVANGVDLVAGYGGVQPQYLTSIDQFASYTAPHLSKQYVQDQNSE